MKILTSRINSIRCPIIFGCRYYFFLAFAFSLSGAYKAESHDWPQWQGPDRDAVSKETDLLQEWPEEGPSLVWKVSEIGSGYGGLSVASDRIFGMSNRGEDEVVWALSEKDGSNVWSTRIGPVVNEGMPQGKEGGGCTPTIDGDRLYVIGRGGSLACLRCSDGQILWQHNLVEDFGGILPNWKYNESPLIDGEKLVCTPGGADATLVALNKMTGETIWKSQLPNTSENEGGRSRNRGRSSSGAAYSSAITIEFEGERQYVQFTSKALAGFAAADGKLLWRYDHPANGFGINCSTPIYTNGYVFAASAYRAGGGLVKLNKDGNGGINADEVWFSKDMENHHGGMLLIDGAIYGANGGNGGGYLVCLDFATGNVLWNEKEPDKRRVKKGSVLLADNRIYYRTEEGEVLLIEPSRMDYIERGRFVQPERTNQPAWTHPIIANGKLYIRDQDTLFCYDVREQ